MPLPRSKDPGKIIEVLKREKPGMPRKQRVAIALERARASGADIPERPERGKRPTRRRS